MQSMRRLPLSPVMLALALSLAAQATVGAEDNAAPTTAPAAVANDGAIASQAAYAEAYAHYRAARFTEAKDKVDEAVRLNPENAQAQSLREDVLAVLGQRDNRVQMAATWFRTLQDVQTQETAVRIGSLIESGKRKLAAGEYPAAELDFDRADVAIRAFPYPFDWGPIPAQVTGLRNEARAHARASEEDRAGKARREAVEHARTQAQLQEEALKAKVDELLSRARESYKRADYKRAEVDAYYAYELDRRREDARSLYLDARREGHASFDDRNETERLERTARVSEEIHRALIPQSELLVYPEDWKRRAQRKPKAIGGGKQEQWMIDLRASLDQIVDVDYQERSLTEVIKDLREKTRANILTSPSVTSKADTTTVTIKASSIRFGNVLKWVMDTTNLHWVMQDQAIYISEEQSTGAANLVMYDVTELIQRAVDMPGKELALSAVNGGGGGGGGGGPALFANNPDANNIKPPSPEDLVDFIKKNVAHDTWERPGLGIEQRAGTSLFITQVPEVHAQIALLLDNLRNQQSLQVQVDIRMLDVRKNFFEEIGVDWARSSFDITASNSDQGYKRLNPNTQIDGKVGTSALGGGGAALPSSQNTAAWGQFSNPSNPRGLVVDLAHSPFNFLGTDQINMIISAAESESSGEVLEHPSLSCFNGQRANASFITQFAYISAYTVVTDNMQPTTGVLSFGNIIDIRPVVSSDHKYITMEVRPSSAALQGVFVESIRAPRIYNNGGRRNGGNNNNNNNIDLITAPIVSYPLELPNIAVKSLRSTVMIPDRASLLIGGFQHSLRERTSVGIPFLSHIPFLGRLFSRNGTYDEDRRLFYMLHAEILDINEKESLQ